MAIDLLGFAVAFQESPEDAHAADPHQLLRHTSIGRTFPLTESAVSALAAGFRVLADAGARVHSLRFLDDQTVLDQLADVLPCKPTAKRRN